MKCKNLYKKIKNLSFDKKTQLFISMIMAVCTILSMISAMLASNTANDIAKSSLENNELLNTPMYRFETRYINDGDSSQTKMYIDVEELGGARYGREIDYDVFVKIKGLDGSNYYIPTYKFYGFGRNRTKDGRSEDYFTMEFYENHFNELIDFRNKDNELRSIDVVMIAKTKTQNYKLELIENYYDVSTNRIFSNEEKTQLDKMWDKLEDMGYADEFDPIKVPNAFVTCIKKLIETGDYKEFKL